MSRSGPSLVGGRGAVPVGERRSAPPSPRPATSSRHACAKSALCTRRAEQSRRPSRAPTQPSPQVRSLADLRALPAVQCPALWDELDGIDWPRIWTAERDREVWAPSRLTALRSPVVGSGPVGQTAALLLARWGIPVVLLDQRTARDVVGSKSICQQRDVLDIWAPVGAGRIAAEGLTWRPHGPSTASTNSSRWSLRGSGPLALPAVRQHLAVAHRRDPRRRLAATADRSAVGPRGHRHLRRTPLA